MNEADVPSPIDFCEPAAAREWERTAQARLGREAMFNAFIRELQALRHADAAILELGSGPAFLASVLLRELPDLTFTLLDSSAAMHELARARLGSLAAEVRFMQQSFTDAGWADNLGPFDAVITNQSVHEVRHKRHAAALHRQVRSVLKPGGLYLVADHFFGDGGMSDSRLYMSPGEQAEALRSAGFIDVACVELSGSLVMHRAVEIA